MTDRRQVAHQVSPLPWRVDVFRNGQLFYASTHCDHRMLVREVYSGLVRIGRNYHEWSVAFHHRDGDGFGVSGSHLDCLSYLAAAGGRDARA